VYVQENVSFYLGRSLARSIFKLLRFELKKEKKESWAYLQKFHFGNPKAKIEIGGKERIIRFSSFPTLCTYELCYLGYFNFSSLAATCRRVFTIFFFIHFDDERARWQGCHTQEDLSPIFPICTFEFCYIGYFIFSLLPYTTFLFTFFPNTLRVK